MVVKKTKILTSDSLVEACTLTWDKTGRPPLRIQELQMNKGFHVLENGQESSRHMHIRQELLEKSLCELSHDFDTYTMQVNAESLNSIVEFVHHAFDASSLCMPYQEIPTALIFGGINSSDHEFLYTQLLSKIGDAGHAVARLYSKDCQTMKGMMKIMIEQFMRLELELADDDREQTLDETLRFISGNKAYHLRNHDLRLLEAWFSNKAKKAKNPSFLVLMIHDFEAFDIQLFLNLVSIMSECQTRLPFVFLLNIATTVDSLQTLLPASTLSLLKTQRFRLCASDKVVNGLTEKLFLNSHSHVKMDSKSLNCLLNEYALFNLSVTSFLNGIKYATMIHYSTCPLSVLLSIDPSESTKDSVIASLETRDLERLRSYPSFQRYIERLLNSEEEKESARKLLTHDTFFRSRIPVLLEELRDYHENFSYAFQCLFSLQTLVNNPAFRKKFAVLYSLSMSTDETFKNGIQILLQIFSKKHLDDIEKYLQIVVKVLEDAPDEMEVSRQKFQDLLDEIETYKDDDGDTDSSDGEGSHEKSGSKRIFKNEDDIPFEAIPKLKQRKTLTSRRTDIIVDGIDEGKDKTFRGFTGRVLATLRSFFGEYLRHFSTQVWYEIMYFRSSARLSKAFFPSTRLITQTAIESPGYFLGSDFDRKERDITILYRLHLECGRLINLYDWFTAFKAVVDPDKKEDSKQLQVRFMQGTSELQFMGFIKTTERKTDHVVRLTWGV